MIKTDLRRDLTSIERDIVYTRTDSGSGPWEREFSWWYTPGLPLERADYSCPADGKNVVLLFMQMKGVLCFSKSLPKKDRVKAIVHNHPSGNVLPSHWDIVTLLKTYEESNVGCSIIASTPGPALLRGFLVMQYKGNRKDVGALIGQVNDFFGHECDRRHEEMDTYPGKFNYILAGDCIFNNREIKQMAIQEMQIAKVDYSLIAIPGCTSKGWGFVWKG